MSDNRSRTNRQRRPWALRRYSSSLRTFVVVGLVVFLVGVAWHVRRDSRYAAEVTVEIAPTVAAIITAGSEPLDDETQFFEPAEILDQLARSLDPRIIDLSTLGPSGSDWHDVIQVTVTRSQAAAPVRLNVQVTDGSESRAKSLASTMGQQLSQQYGETARAVTQQAPPRASERYEKRISV